MRSPFTVAARLLAPSIIAAFVGSASAGDPPARLESTAGGGRPPGPVLDRGHQCIPDAERAAAEARVAENIIKLGLSTADRGPAGSYAFWPQGGTLGRDVFTNNFVDLDPTTGLRDYDCGNWTYDGHNGHDMDLRSFSEQAAGVPIFAVLDGTVVDVLDGQPDMNTSCMGQGNHVILHHGGTHRTWYWHMKNGSVAVSLGQVVRAGQQLGLTASSGCSTGPHLHFETSVPAVYEPFRGACLSGPSGWVNQYVPDRTSIYLRDFGFTNSSLASFAGPPFPYPRVSHATFADPIIYYWMQGHNLPPSPTFRWRFYRPDGSLALESSPIVPGWANGQFRWWWAWFSWSVAEMRTIAGTWRVQIIINGATVIDSPIEVKAARDSAFNRRPNPVTLVFDPPTPIPSSVIFCRVTSTMINDDPDYDVVSYRYQWKVNGATVRDVTLGAMSDAVPRDTLRFGAEVVCTVTPSDAGGVGPSTSIRFGCAADYNGFGGVSTQDVFDFLAGYFTRSPQADINGVGGHSLQDIFDYLALYFTGCS